MDQNNGFECRKENEFQADNDIPCEKQHRRVSVQERIYNALDIMERIAIKLSKLNHSIRSARKKRIKRIGKFDTKTGVIILKRQKSTKKAKLYKRYQQKAK